MNAASIEIAGTCTHCGAELVFALLTPESEIRAAIRDHLAECTGRAS